MIWSWIKSFFKKEKQAPVHQGWEQSWSNFLENKLSGDTLKTLMAASDVTKIRPDFFIIEDSEKIKTWVEFFKALAFFESGYDPKCQAVDVGVYGDRNTWSIGLLQLSVIDQSNLGLRYGYTFIDLLQPEKNLDFGIEIMKNQIRKRGKIFIPKGEKGNPSIYWATLCPGGKYDKSKQIIEWIRSLA